jgi:hypothetical protein
MRIAVLMLSVLAAGCNSSMKTDKATIGALNSNSPYVWLDYNAPKALGVSRSFTTDEKAAVRDMGSAWTSAVNNRKTFFDNSADIDEITTNITNLTGLLDPVMGVYKTNPWPSSLPGSALAVTQIFGRRYNIGTSTEFTSIEHADILVNYQLYTYDTAAFGSGFDFQTVILHEMGHFIGLQHKDSTSSRNASVMYPSIDSSESKRAPKSVDISDIASKYSINLYLTAASAMSAGAAPAPHQIEEGDKGEPLRILLELHADGNCVHKENGIEVHRHPASLSPTR